MVLKNTVKLAYLPLLLISGGIFAADNSAIVGQWSLELSVQGQTVPVSLTISEDGDELGGTWVGPAGSNTLSGVNFDGNALSFSMQTQQGSMSVSFELKDNTLDGGLASPMGNLPVVGKKSS